MRSGPKVPRARRGSGRWTSPSSSSLGAGSCMCRQPGPCGCAVGGCMPTPKATHWPSVGSTWGKGGWRRLSHLMGRARARPGVRSLGSVVRSVGSRWWARLASPARASPRQPRWAGRRWHEGEHGRGRSEVDQGGLVGPAAERNTAPGYPRWLHAWPASCCWGATPSQRLPWGAHKGVTARWDRCPISIAQEPGVPDAVRGSSNPALKRTAASVGAGLGIGLAAA
jgi:hypothetical protein